MEPNPGIDFNFFSSASVPYNYYGLPPTPQAESPYVEGYKNFHGNEQFDPSYAVFQQHFNYNSQFIAPIPPQGNRPPLPTDAHSITPLPTQNHDQNLDQNLDYPLDTDITPEDGPQLHRSSSEDKDGAAPQSNKRKAQNRAAQRAFRERKEKHTKDLEARNDSLQQQHASLNNEIQRLQRELKRATTENEILRATSGSTANGPTPFLVESDRDDLDSISVSHGYIPTDYSSRLKQSKDKTTDWSPPNKWAQFGTLKQIPVDEENGEQLYTAGQTWDYIQSSETFKKGLVDVGDVCERLKKLARCDGQGPVFVESDIRKAISDSAVAGGRDELI